MNRRRSRFVLAASWLAAWSFLTGSACTKQQAPAERLQAAYSAAPHRPLALRLHGFAYVARPRVLRGAPDDQRAMLRLRTVAMITADEAKDDHLGGVSQLLAGKQASAVRLLTRSASTSRDPAAWNDLAVALFEQGAAADDPRGIARALSAIDEALARERSQEALFNRAAILEALGLREAAANAWDSYLNVDRTSSWTGEVREHLRQCRRSTSRQQWNDVRPQLERAVASNQMEDVTRLVRAYPLEARTWCEGQYLALWAEAYQAGRADEAARQLAVAAAVGARLREINGEQLLERAADAVVRAQHAGDLPTLQALAEASLTYRQGRIALKSGRPIEALSLLERAEGLFQRGHSPMALVSRYFRADTLIDSRRLAEADALLESVRMQARPEFIALNAQVLWARSRVGARSGRFYDALDDARAATRLLQRVGEREYAAQTLTIVAAALAAMGQPVEAWKIRRQVFETASDCGAAWVIENALDAAARDEILENDLRLALSLFDVLLAEPEQAPLLRFDALLWRTFVAARLSGGGSADLNALRIAGARLKDSSQRELAEAETTFAEALLTEGDPSRKVRLLTSAIAFREHDYGALYLPTAYVERARALRSLGDDDEAASDLERALDVFDRQAGSVADAPLRDSFFASARTACLDLADVRLQQQRPELAFMALGRCRGNTVQPIAAIQNVLAPKTVLVQYAFFDERMVAFGVTHAGLRVVTVGRRRQQIRDDVVALGAAARGGDARAFEERSNQLYATLIAPLQSVLPGCDSLMVVASEIVDEVPLAALHPPTDSPVAQRFDVLVAPTTNLPVAARRTSSVRALVVGDPAFDRSRFQGLPRLASAAEEGRAIHALYGDSDLLIGSEATVERFRELAPRSDIIHVAMHALVSDRDAGASVLLFAPGESDDGLLYLRSVASMKLDAAPLVVLAGCDTATRGGGHGSMRSFASAFLAAGSRSTVASLWPVDDEITRVFTTYLHAELRSGATLAAATRAAQLRMMTSREPRLASPAAWGAFQVYGYE